MIARLKIINHYDRMDVVKALSENGYRVWIQTTVRNGVLVCFEAKDGYVNEPIMVDEEEGKNDC